MESSAQRRLACVSRHLLLPGQSNHLLYRVSVKSEKTNHEEADPVVIGGMVLDIHATPSIPLKPRTTTPGKVHYVLGGVARNIAECMSRLGSRPYMISALGIDMAGDLLLENWYAAGLSIAGIRKLQDGKTAIICNIFDTDGELVAGVANVEAVEKFLTPEWIQQSRSNICSAPILMVDANLNPPTLEASCQLAAESNIPVWFEPVSVAKSRRIASIAKYVTIVSPNEYELIAMANALCHKDMFCSVETDNSKTYSAGSLFQKLKPAILMLLEKGIRIVLVTLGAHGVFLCAKWPKLISILERTKKNGFSQHLYDIMATNCLSRRLFVSMQTEGSSDLVAVHLPAAPASVVRLSGAGDCLVGGTLVSLCVGLDVVQSVAVGIAVAKTAVEAETNVPPVLNVAKIADDARSVFSAAKVWSML